MNRNLYVIHLEVRKDSAENAKLKMYDAAAEQIGSRYVLIKRTSIKKDGNPVFDYAGFSGMPGRDYADHARSLDIYFSLDAEETLAMDTALLRTISDIRKQIAGELYAVGVTIYTKRSKTEKDYEPGFRLDHCFAFEDAHAAGYEYLGVNELIEQFTEQYAEPLLNDFRK